MHDNSSSPLPRRWSIFFMITAVTAIGLTFATPAPLRAQTASADAIVDADAEFRCQRTSAWEEGSARFLLLERDVAVALGTYGFRADRAVVRIDEAPHGGGRVYHLAMYLDNARALPGRGPTSAEAKRLLVTASTTGGLDLVTDLLREASAGTDPLVEEARGRIDEYLSAVAQSTTGPLNVRMAEGSRVAPAEAEELTAVMRRPVEGLDIPIVDRGAIGADGEVITTADGQVAVRPSVSTNVLPTSGVVSFRADKIVIKGVQKGVGESGERLLVLIGHVRVVYQSGKKAGQGMSLSADNAVIFLAGEGLSEISERDAQAKDIKGVYLEDNVVATDGDYTIRSPRVFYDVSKNKAVLLDAVMYSWDIKRQVPIYVRAEKLMQHTSNTFGAERATLTTSEFAKPHFAIGARQVTVRQSTRADGSVRHTFTAQGNTARLGSVPVFYWPRVSGEIQNFPIRELDVAYNENDGPTIRTAWDLFALTNTDKPSGVDLIGRLDYLGDHGPAGGINLDYDHGETFGKLDAYAVFFDQGDDEIADRDKVDHDGDTRGYAHWQHRAMMDDIEVSIEAAYVSDPSFLEEFFREEAEESKQYETSLYLKKQDQNTALTLLFKTDLNDFVSQTTTYQTSGHPTSEAPGPGYTVDKAPEVSLQHIGKTFWGDRLTYFGSSSASYMRINEPTDNPRDRGFTTLQSLGIFGIANTTDLDDVIDLFGANDDWIARFDSRHEVQMPMKFSIIDVVPYIAGRVTVYSDDTRSGDDLTIENNDDVRWWGSVGTRLHTQFSRTYERVSSKLFDLHRLRHIIEPSVDIFASSANTETEDYAIFDYDVEALNKGFGAKLGLLNTLQTQRGGQGRWRTVDWLVLQTDLIFREGEEEPALGVREVFPRYFSSRPENSFGGDMFYGNLMWMISDTLAMVGDTTIDLNNSDNYEWRLGMNLQHSPLLTLYMDYTDLHHLDSRLFRWGFDYRLTTKYTLGFTQQTNLADTGDRSMQLTLVRELPRWKMILVADIDDLEDDQTIGIVFVPDGLGGSRHRRPTFVDGYFN